MFDQVVAVILRIISWLFLIVAIILAASILSLSNWSLLPQGYTLPAGQQLPSFAPLFVLVAAVIFLQGLTAWAILNLFASMASNLVTMRETLADLLHVTRVREMSSPPVQRGWLTGTAPKDRNFPR